MDRRLHSVAILCTLTGMPAGVGFGQAKPPLADSPMMKQDKAPQNVLLREGSELLDAIGHMTRDEKGTWVIQVDRSDPGDPPLVLILLPCTVLSDMERSLETLDESTVRFELTGEVLVYRNRNFLLPTHAPRLVEAAAAPVKGDPAAGAASGATDAQRQGDAQGGDPNARSTPPTRTERQAGDRAQEIIQSLVQETGPIARVDPGGSARAAARQDAMQPLLREDTVLVNRRGVLTRDLGGAWSVVFDSDAQGLADPPMRLLPCLLLERMTAYAQRAGRSAPVLVSGRVTTYGGRNFLMPTLYRVPNDRTLIRTP